MDNFLDTCVIVASFDTAESHHKVAREFIKESDNFLIAKYQKDPEIIWLFKRKKRIVISVLRSMTNEKIDVLGSYDLKKELRRLLQKYSLENPTLKNLKSLLLILNYLEREVRNFVNTKVKKIIPNCEDRKLIKSLEIANIPDAKIIASALVEHQDNPLILNTLDKKDWEKKKIKRACYRNDLVIPRINYI